MTDDGGTWIAIALSIPSAAIGLLLLATALSSKLRKSRLVGGAGSYLAKYFAKDFLYAKDRLLLGFSRAWSRSRTWPVDKLMLQATKEKQWVRISFRPIVEKEAVKDKRWAENVKVRNKWWLDHSVGSKHLERTGTDLALALAGRRDYERLKGTMSRMRSLLQ